MQGFLEDYDVGRVEGRYVNGALPVLPFADAVFDLALCSHLLFLYSSQLGKPFHLAAVREMCRVAAEVRVFPLLALGGKRSPYVDHCTEDLRGLGFDVVVQSVSYEFQRGGDQMMRIRTAGTERPRGAMHQLLDPISHQGRFE